MVASYRVALVGATGLLGPHVLEQLLQSQFASFEVTILARLGSKFTHSSPKVRTVNLEYSNYSRVVAVLTGHTYLISLIGSGGKEAEKSLTNAAIAAGVPRIFTNEYSLDWLNPAAKSVTKPLFMADRVEQAERIEAEGQDGSIQWTTLMTGGLLPWIISSGFAGFDIKDRKATLYDSGVNMATGSTLDFVGASVAYAAAHWDQVKNRRVPVAEVAYTGREILQLLEKRVGAKFEIQEQRTADLRTEGEEKYKTGDIAGATRDLIISLNFNNSGVGNLTDGLDFGKGEIPRKSLEQIVGEAVESTGSDTNDR